MVALNERQIAIVRTLVESAPDRVVGRLQEALVESGGDSALAGVRRLVEIEAKDRRLRNTILSPIAPMCVGDGVSDRRLIFPARALSSLWRGLRDLAPDVVAAAETLVAEEPDETSPRAFDAMTRSLDALTRLAASALRTREQRDFFVAAELCDRARPGGAEALAACLDLAPVVRKAIVRLPDWIGHSGEDTTAAARLAYKDAVTIAEDAGPRLFEMLAAQLSTPWMVLRVISAVMDKPTERYMADSEVGGFGEGVMTEIDDALVAIGKLDLDAGPEAGRAAGKLVELISLQTAELEACIELSRDHGWGHRIVNQRKALAGLVEGRLREAEKLSAAALPSEMISKQRMRRSLPRLTAAPDARAVTRATTLLVFTQEIRSSANYAGFSAAHTKTLENVGAMLDHYVEDVLDHLKTGDVADVTIAAAFLAIAADFCQLIRDEKAGALIRRRAAVACHGDPSARLVPQAG
ncbi:MAG: hypothetical protein JWQ29_2994 [Phenylobacterium sp.]|nr:hypothetical protein [Phenylobacterium sp.]